MKNFVKFILSIVLIFAIFVSLLVVPASSYENDVETSTEFMMLVNMDTDTVVYSRRPDSIWYAGYLNELVTFLLVREMLSEPEKVVYQVDDAYASTLPHSDGCLKQFSGLELTAADLIGIMLISSGNDAAYALADLASNGDRESFVSAMNQKAAELGCVGTNFVSPAYESVREHHTTCRDILRIYKEVLKDDYYQQVMKEKSYVPAAFAGTPQEEQYTVYPEASILNEKSPYYFRYVNDAMYSHTEFTFANIALTTTYRGQTYCFIGLKGLNESEKNIYADARKLTTWAYLNLSDQKLFDEDKSLIQVEVSTGWGSYPLDINPANSAYKTFPNDYDESLLEMDFNVPDVVETPLFSGQSVGQTKVTYAGEEIDTIDLVVNSDEGLDMLGDLGRFSSFVLNDLIPVKNRSKGPDDASPASSDEALSPETQSEATEG